MNIIKHFLLIALFIGLSHSFSFSQKVKDRDIDNYIANGDIPEAIEALKNKLSSKPDNPDNLQKLGYCYLITPTLTAESVDIFKKAAKLYQKKENKKGYFDARFYLAKAYHKTYYFDNALELYNELIIEGKSNDYKSITALEKQILYCENAKKFKFDRNNIIVKNLSEINTKYAEHSPVVTANEDFIIFTSMRKTNLAERKQNNKEYDEDIYITKLVNGEPLKQTRLKKPINTNENDANCGLSGDGKILYIYKNEDIYACKYMEDNKWGDPERIGKHINSKYRESHLSISADKNTMYFSSDRPGGFGGTDIYKTEKDENGKWKKPVNLGKNINTNLNEDSPYIHQDNSLFFSSQGHNSIGGYDIFYSKINSDGSFSKVKNPGYPTNTVADDVYYFLSPDKKRAYLSSSRSGGKGSMDIYYIDYVDSSKVYLTVNGNVKTGIDNNEKAHITIKEIRTKDKINNPLPDKIGDYSSVVKKGKTYFISLEADSCFFDAFTFSSPQDKEKTKKLKSSKLKKIDYGQVNQKYLVNFDKNKTKLNNVAELLLNTLVRFLKANTKLRVDFTASKHDDDKSRKKSTQNIIDFLRDKGISESRISVDLSSYNVKKNNVLFTLLDSTSQALAFQKQIEKSEAKPDEMFHGKFLQKGFYTVQIGAFSKEIGNKNKFFKDFRGRVILFHGYDKLFRYTYGNYKYKTDAQKNLLIIQRMGFKDAFIREISWYKKQVY